MMENGRELVERLLACGFTESSALDICQYYAARSDWRGLREYIETAERTLKEEVC